MVSISIGNPRILNSVLGPIPSTNQIITGAKIISEIDPLNYSFKNVGGKLLLIFLGFENIILDLYKKIKVQIFEENIGLLRKIW